MSDFIDEYVVDSTREGIVIYVTGWEKIWEPFRYEDIEGNLFDDPYEGEWIENVGGNLRGHYVGDDMELILDPDNLTIVDEDQVCSCGQVGCKAYALAG